MCLTAKDTLHENCYTDASQFTALGPTFATVIHKHMVANTQSYHHAGGFHLRSRTRRNCRKTSTVQHTQLIANCSFSTSQILNIHHSLLNINDVHVKIEMYRQMK